MRSSVTAFMAGIMDYAGLFPPARLPLDEALGRFLEHRRGPDGWLLARFVCPATRLDGLAPLLEELDEGEPAVPLVVLGRGADGADRLPDAVAADVDAAQRLVETTAGRARFDQLEVRLPPDAGGRVLVHAVGDAARRLRDAAATPPSPFFEPSLLAGWRERLPAAVAAVAGAHRESAPAGLKIRCGGTDAGAVPEVEAVAAALAACDREGLPLKATQGLHHPLRHFDPDLGTEMHGFVNLFAAGLLGLRHRLDEGRLAAVLGEERADAFEFTEGELRWSGLAVDLADIAAGRRHRMTSFGSCSFSEPRDHLRAMGLLERQPAAAGSGSRP